jgi:hypothetical protein
VSCGPVPGCPNMRHHGAHDAFYIGNMNDIMDFRWTGTILFTDSAKRSRVSRKWWKFLN